MTFVITDACTDVLDRACILECPVDCIYEGSRALYIHPVECVDCGACEPACPVDAIYYEDDVPDSTISSIQDNADFFELVLPGRSEPLGTPMGAKRIGPVGVDTPLVAARPPGQAHAEDETG
jgi:NAD-dependent dihydropyrimidine dehydrogenase PreA subunit